MQPKYFAIRSKDDLLRAAYQTAPAFFRLLHLSIPRWWLRRRHPWLCPDLAALDSHARVLPFIINKNTLAMRAGFVVVRGGQPSDVWLTMVS